jgi:hypothetical protein
MLSSFARLCTCSLEHAARSLRSISGCGKPHVDTIKLRAPSCCPHIIPPLPRFSLWRYGRPLGRAEDFTHMKTKAPVLSGAIRNTVPGVLAGGATSPAGKGDGVGVGVAAGTMPA